MVSKFDHLACFVFTPAHMMPRYDDLMKRTVADIMTSEFIYVGTDTRLTRVLQLMVDHRIRSMPVIDGDQRLGGHDLPRRRDARIAAKFRRQIAACPLARIRLCRRIIHASDHPDGTMITEPSHKVHLSQKDLDRLHELRRKDPLEAYRSPF